MEQLSLLDLLDRPPLESLFKPDQIYESDDFSLFSRLTEDARFERKSGRAQASVLAKCLSAFGNGPSVDGGVVAIGLEKDGSVSGCGHLQQDKLSDAETCGINLCPEARYKSRRVPVVNANGEEDFIILVRISYVDDRLVHLTDGTAYERQGDKSVTLSDDRKQDLRIDKGQRSFELEACALKYPEDFDENKIARFCGLLKRNAKATEPHSNEELLQAAHLSKIRNGELVPNNACTLLFSKDPQSVFPGSYVHFLRYEGIEAKSGRDYNVIKDRLVSGTVTDIIKEVSSLLDNSLREFTEYKNGKFATVPEYPRDAWYEALVNAVVHRSYHIKSAPIFIRVFDDRMEIESPGGFMPQVTPENIVGMHRPRNLFLMLALREFGEVRCIAEGTRRIVAEMQGALLPPPEFRQLRAGSHSVICTLRNNVSNRSNSLDSEAYKILGETIAFSLGSEEKKVVNYVLEHGKIKTSDALRILRTTRWHTAKKIMDELARRGILVLHGEDRPRNPNRFYALTGKVPHGKA